MPIKIEITGENAKDVMNEMATLLSLKDSVVFTVCHTGKDATPTVIEPEPEPEPEPKKTPAKPRKPRAKKVEKTEEAPAPEAEPKAEPEAPSPVDEPVDEAAEQKAAKEEAIKILIDLYTAKTKEAKPFIKTLLEEYAVKKFSEVPDEHGKKLLDQANDILSKTK